MNSKILQLNKANDTRFRKAIATHNEFMEAAGRRRAAQLRGVPTEEIDDSKWTEEIMGLRPPTPNFLTPQRLRMMEQRINSDRRHIDPKLNPPAKIPAEPGQSGSSGVMRVNTGQRIQLSKGYVEDQRITRGAEPTPEELHQKHLFEESMEKARAQFITDNYGKVASIELGKQSLNLPELMADLKKRGCRCRDIDEHFVEAQCRVE